MEEDIKRISNLIGYIENADYVNASQCFDNEDIQAISNLLTRYKQLEEENKELKRKSDRDEILQDISDDFIKAYKRNSIPKSKVKEKIEELKHIVDKYEKQRENDEETDLCYEEVREYACKMNALQELLESGD